MAACIASRWPPSRGRAAMIVRSTRGRTPARGRHQAFHDLGEELATGDARGRRRPGREDAARGRPAPAAPSSASHDGVEGDVAIGVAGEPGRALDRDAAQHERRPGPERMRVVPDPGTDRRTVGGQQGGHTGEIVGHGHLEIARVAGDGMDGDCTGLEQGGLIGPGPGGRRSGPRRPRASTPRRTPWGVWAAPRRRPGRRSRRRGRRRGA